MMSSKGSDQKDVSQNLGEEWGDTLLRKTGSLEICILLDDEEPEYVTIPTPEPLDHGLDW